MVKLLKIISLTVLGLVILISLCAPVALFYSEQIDLLDGADIPNCTSVFDSTYSTEIEQSRLILKSMMKACDLPALSVAVSKDNKLIWSEAFGFSNLESKSQACPESIFRIGSVSKTLTAVALIKLSEEKKLSLHEDIQPPLIYSERIVFVGF
jgi:CubicO group peptidase (beta-lactamase class C family)